MESGFAVAPLAANVIRIAPEIAIHRIPLFIETSPHNPTQLPHDCPALFGKEDAGEWNAKEEPCQELVQALALIQSGASPSKDDFTEAKGALGKSIAARPDCGSSQIALGRLLLQEGRVDAAMEHLDLGRQLAPQDPSCYLLLATAYRKRGQPEQARAMRAMVAKLNEEQAEKRRLAFDKNH